MQEGLPHYQEGAKNLSLRMQHFAQRFSKTFPPGMLDDLTKKALVGIQDVLATGLSLILENVSETLFQLLMMLLYMVFWLCQPMHVSKSISGLFRQYIYLKSIASGGYAFCVWLLLHFSNIDLAIVFGLVTFLFNFVPEVGPFMAMVLPLPVVLFDARIKEPIIQLCIVLGGNLLLKFVWANILEVKLVESQREMRMHPVVILFFVAFFGWIWGATGMLLSVPLVAVVKASMHLFPASYRDPILTFLEGDSRAPERYTRAITRARHRAQTVSTLQSG
jgi:AI-2 transport protein TqsA